MWEEKEEGGGMWEKVVFMTEQKLSGCNGGGRLGGGHCFDAASEASTRVSLAGIELAERH